MRIDAHQHFWKASRGDYHWMTPEIGVLCHDYLPKNLEPHLRKNRIDKTILVQAAQTVAETDFLLGLSEKHPFIAGVVGWIDMDRDDFPEQLDRYMNNPKFIGLRPMLQDIPEDDWILRPRVVESLKAVAEKDFPFEFLTYTRHLPHVLKVLDRVPHLRAAVDHLSKPGIKTKQMKPWKDLMAEVAGHPNVSCKLSGMITEADWKNWKPDDLKPYVEHIWERFGTDRVMYGSDWPVCLCAGSYDQVIGTLEEILKPRLDPGTSVKVFGENARSFYKL
jgi:L-fuconolactonase